MPNETKLPLTFFCFYGWFKFDRFTPPYSKPPKIVFENGFFYIYLYIYIFRTAFESKMINHRLLTGVTQSWPTQCNTVRSRCQVCSSAFWFFDFCFSTDFISFGWQERRIIIGFFFSPRHDRK